jgi:hypothetical protein
MPQALQNQKALTGQRTPKKALRIQRTPKKKNVAGARFLPTESGPDNRIQSARASP